MRVEKRELRIDSWTPTPGQVWLDGWTYTDNAEKTAQYYKNILQIAIDEYNSGIKSSRVQLAKFYIQRLQACGIQCEVVKIQGEG